MSEVNSIETRSGLLPEAARALLEGNIARAEKWALLHLKSNPNDVEGRTLLATIFAKSKRIEEAKALLLTVTEEAPFFEAHVTLSTIYFYENRIAEALSEAEKAIQLQPRELATYNKTGHELVRKELIEEAIAYFRRAVEYGPTDIDSNQNLAAALKDAGHLEQSLEVWDRVINLAPDHIIGWLSYGMLQLSSADHVKALEAANEAIKLDGRNLEAWILGGLANTELGELHEAERFFRQALLLDPNQPLALASLGVALHEQGKFEDSTKWLRRSLEKWDSNGLAYYIMARSKKVTAADQPFLDSLKKVVDNPKVGLLDRSYMEYALGKSLEDLKDYESSMRHFDRANELAYDFWFSGRPWDKERYRFTTDKTLETFSAERVNSLRTLANYSELPILIVGMIRSGTTLVEQILSSHPEIAGAGELTYWHDEAGRCFDVDSGRIAEDRLRASAEGYLELLRSKGHRAKRVTDKLPHNYAVLGLVNPTLPNARIIHIRRNPLDNCLSVYTTGFNRPPGFTLTREFIVFAYKEYLRLVEHWRQILPEDRFLEIDYEELISNKDYVTRKMIDFVGLEWDPKCLEHEKNDRIVQTPSAWQVRQPVYTTSVARWKNFEPWLREFKVFLPST